MKRIRLRVAYDGTNYCGWQIQPNGITIEEVLNKAITKLTKVETAVIGASRTDSGVHALGNVAVFDTESTIPPERFSYALNQRLPEDIVVVASDEVPLDWHPRYQDVSKTYEYHVIHTRIPDPTRRLTNYFVSYPLDIEAMRKAASYLEGTHDFVSFCNIRTNVEDTDGIQSGSSDERRSDYVSHPGEWVPLQYGADHCRNPAESRTGLLYTGTGKRDSGSEESKIRRCDSASAWADADGD